MCFRLGMILYAVFYGSFSVAGGLCGEIEHEVGSFEEEREYLLRVCQSELNTHNGVLLFIEGGFLPFLEEFYVKLPNSNEIVLGSSRSPRLQSFSDKMKWPYGLIWVRPFENSDARLSDLDVSPAASYGLSRAAEDCDLTISLVSYERKAPDLDFVAHFHELTIGGTQILFGGASDALAIVTAETFARLNCR